MAQLAYNLIGFIQVHERDNNGVITRQLGDFEMHHRLDNDSHFQISVEKALTSTGSTATVTVTNHKVLELLYTEQRSLLKKWSELNLELSIVLYFQYPNANTQSNFTNCIFTGDIVDISVGESTTTLDQNLIIKASMGYRPNLRAMVTSDTLKDGKYYTSLDYPTTYDVVLDLFKFFEPYGYELQVIEDPFNLLSKPWKRSKTLKGKVSDNLNTIAKDLDMVWGYDSNPWTLDERSLSGLYPNQPNNIATIYDNKHCYWVDKRAVFDVSRLHAGTGTDKPSYNGINSLRVSGDTGHIGLIGYTKAQFSFNSLFDCSYNIGMPVLADDVRAHLVEDYQRTWGRINRVSINNDVIHCECSYIDEDTGYTSLDNDGKNTGGLLV